MRDSMGSEHVSHRRTSAFDDHLDHCFIIFKNAKHGFEVRRVTVSLRFAVGVSVLALDFISPNVVRRTNTSKTRSQRSRAGIPSMRRPASKETTSDSTILCDAEVCFLHIQLMGTTVRLLKIQQILPRLT